MRAPPSLRTAWRSPGSKRRSVPGPASRDAAVGVELHGAVQDGDPRVLLDLVVAELLARVEDDEHGARLVRGMENDRVARALGRLELEQVPRRPSRAFYHAEGRSYTRPTVALAVDRYELGPIGTNCYVVRASSAAQEAVVIDPGDDATELRRELERCGARVAGILITHTHFDHIGGIADLAEATGAPV